MSTVGTRAATGPRNVVQCRTSSERARRREADRIPERRRGRRSTRGRPAERRGARARAPVDREVRRGARARAVPSRRGSARAARCRPRPHHGSSRAAARTSVLRRVVHHQLERLLEVAPLDSVVLGVERRLPVGRRVRDERVDGDRLDARRVARADGRRVVEQRVRERDRQRPHLRPRGPFPRGARAAPRPAASRPARARPPRGSSSRAAREHGAGRGAPVRGARRRRSPGHLSRPRLLVPAQEDLADGAPRERLHVLEAERDEPSRSARARSMAAANAAGSSGSARTAASPARLVQRLVRGDDDGDAARHRLDHGNPEALEARRVRDDGGAAVEARELLVRDEPEPPDPRPVEERLLAPTLGRRRRRARGRRRAGGAPRRAPAGSSAARASRR